MFTLGSLSELRKIDKNNFLFLNWFHDILFCFKAKNKRKACKTSWMINEQLFLIPAHLWEKRIELNAIFPLFFFFFISGWTFANFAHPKRFDNEILNPKYFFLDAEHDLNTKRVFVGDWKKKLMYESDFWKINVTRISRVSGC